MQLSINVGAEEVSKKLKSTYGSKIKQKKKGRFYVYSRGNYVYSRLYYVHSTWYQSVKIILTPLSEQKTSVSVSVAYTDRLQEVLLLGFGVLFALLNMGLQLPFLFGLPSLIGLAILPHITTKPLVQEVVSSITPVHQQSVPMPQVSSRERELYHQSRQAQIEAQRLRQLLANQAQLTQQLQSEAAQKQMSDAALAQKQQELAVAQKEKEELEAKLAEAEKNTSIVQNITYNIQDSAISGDITNKITRNDSE